MRYLRKPDPGFVSAAQGFGAVSFGAPTAHPAGFLGTAPSQVMRSSFAGPEDTLRAMEQIALGDRGERSAKVRQFTEMVTREIFPKDYLGEILAVRNCFLMSSPKDPSIPMFRYMNDPLHVEWIKDPERQVEEIEEMGSTVTDCDESTVMAATMCLQLGRKVELVALGYSPKELTHVGCRVQEPKSSTWIWVDPVAGPRERDSAEQAQEILYWSLE